MLLDCRSNDRCECVAYSFAPPLCLSPSNDMSSPEHVIFEIIFIYIRGFHLPILVDLLHIRSLSLHSIILIIIIIIIIIHKMVKVKLSDPAKLTDFKALSFDVYSTLIDEPGDNLSMSNKKFFLNFHSISTSQISPYLPASISHTNANS
jgi:hypothetical protein